MKANIIEELRWRGLLFDQTEGAEQVISVEKVKAYIGFDPTADSLHIGSLVPIMILVHLQRHGHTALGLVGGATGMIGDPSGKSKERNLLDTAQLEHNIDCIREQLSLFLDFDHPTVPADLVNNYDWFSPLTFIEILRDIGKHFPLSYMLAKESVKRRVASAGISFTEFSYMILQAYDFYHLFKERECAFQFGGSDQWGNITAGTELIRRALDRKAHGVVFPLVTTATGEKFGKTADGAIWLSPHKTSPYKFYQFWMNCADEDALRYLKYFTLIDEETFDALALEHAEAPHKRIAQRWLAEDVTRRVHDQSTLDRVLQASAVMFGGDLTTLTADEISEIFNEVPSVELQRSSLEGEGVSIFDLFVSCGAVKSRGEARRLMLGGGVNLNQRRIDDIAYRVRTEDAIEGRFVVLRKGAKKYFLGRVTD